MDISKTKENGINLISLTGRLDTVTAPDFQPELLAAIEETVGVIIDLSQIEYVSSAGLRVLLSGHKAAKAAGGKQVIRGVSDEIMEVFEMTGFADMFDIEA